MARLSAPQIARRHAAFLALHRREGAFVLPNAWDAGSARLLASLGFEALATTSAGLAFSKGVKDSAAALTRRDVLDNAREIVEATDLPVSADLEDGFGASPRECADTIRAAAEVGLVGGSIEDASGDADAPIFPLEQATARVAAAVEAARGLPFVLTARAENFLWGRPDLDDVVARLQAFEAAGADVLYAPGLPDLAAVRRVCAAVARPVNVVTGLGPARWSVAELAQAGARRVSVGGSLARAAWGGLHRAARELREHGTVAYADAATPAGEIEALMSTTKR
jgi:2-methylisocitrate lyase-like PEP mutase family enzyme